MNTRISLTMGDGLEQCSLTDIKLLPLCENCSAFPIRHETIALSLTRAVELQGDKVRDSFHAITPDRAKYVGIFDIQTPESSDFRWAVMATNANNGASAFELHTGIVIPAAEMSVGFQFTDMIMKRNRLLVLDELQDLVNESLVKLKDYYNLSFMRMEHLKSKKLTREEASDIIVRLLGTEVVAGRLAHELITLWTKPQLDYLKPRTMWSLFCLSLWLLQRLRAYAIVDRTTDLHHFFDDISKFDKKPTRWVQKTFA
jgi:hypothetical protein